MTALESTARELAESAASLMEALEDGRYPDSNTANDWARELATGVLALGEEIRLFLTGVDAALARSTTASGTVHDTAQHATDLADARENALDILRAIAHTYSATTAEDANQEGPEAQ